MPMLLVCFAATFAAAAATVALGQDWKLVAQAPVSLTGTVVVTERGGESVLMCGGRVPATSDYSELVFRFFVGNSSWVQLAGGITACAYGSAGAYWAPGDRTYTLGGLTTGGLQNGIYRFERGQEANPILGAEGLTQPAYGMACAPGETGSLLFCFGGNTVAAGVTDRLFTFDMQTEGVADVSYGGHAVTARGFAHMAPLGAQRQRLVLFGGFPDLDGPYVLDVSSLTWSDASSTYPVTATSPSVVYTDWLHRVIIYTPSPSFRLIRITAGGGFEQFANISGANPHAIGGASSTYVPVTTPGDPGGCFFYGSQTPSAAADCTYLEFVQDTPTTGTTGTGAPSPAPPPTSAPTPGTTATTATPLTTTTAATTAATGASTAASAPPPPPPPAPPGPSSTIVDGQDSDGDDDDDDDDDADNGLVIGLGVAAAGAVLLVAIIVAAALLLRRQKLRAAQPDEDSGIDFAGDGGAHTATSNTNANASDDAGTYHNLPTTEGDPGGGGSKNVGAYHNLPTTSSP